MIAQCGLPRAELNPKSAIASPLPCGSPLNNYTARGDVLPNPQSEIRIPQSDQLLSSLSAFSSRVSMLKGLLM